MADLRTQALIRYACKTQGDPVSYLENLLFNQIDEITQTGRIIETANGGKVVKFSFIRGEAPGELIMAAINYIETLQNSCETPSDLKRAVFTHVQL